MKWIFFFCLIAFSSKVSAQVIVPSISAEDNIKTKEDITITSAATPSLLHDGKVETPGNLTFTNAQLDLRSITIKAKRITIPATVTNIKIAGNVKFMCEDLVIQTTAAAIPLLCEGDGSLTFFYTQTLTISKPISQQPTNGQTLTVSYKKVN